jgi:hypothetical protein
MAKFYTPEGLLVEASIDHTIYKEADSKKMSVSTLLNSKYPTDPSKYGSATDQLLASVGFSLPGSRAYKDHGRSAPSMADIFEGRAGFEAASNNQGFGSPIGLQARAMFPIALLEAVEIDLVKDYATRANLWDQMISTNLSVGTAAFEQPQVNYKTAGGPQQARPQHRAQGAEPTSVMLISTSNKIRKIPSYAMGVEITNEALKATTFDFVAATVARRLLVERDLRVDEQISDVLNGDLDLNIGSLASLGLTVTSNSLDAAATGGVLTQKAWLKFLYRKQDFAIRDYAIMDLDTYLKVEARTGRPSLTAIDLTLPRMEAQATVSNNLLGDVKVMLVKSAADGGPLPANTILALDSRSALTRATNLSASVTAAEQYAMRQVEAFMIENGDMVYRNYNDAFDVLTIS